MRNAFLEQLEELKREISRLGEICACAIEKAIKAFLKRDKGSAAEVLDVPSEADKTEREVENMCLKLYMKQQPVATDLRNVSAALKLITDIKRIGDIAADIGDITIKAECNEEPGIDELSKMAECVVGMVRLSIKAFNEGDEKMARDVIAQDDVADNYFLEIRKLLISKIKGEEIGEMAVDILMVTKYLEKVGDHAANIAKWVVFSQTGDLPEV